MESESRSGARAVATGGERHGARRAAALLTLGVLSGTALGQGTLYELDGRTPDDAFGRRIVPLDDLDGDGAAEYAVGAPEDGTVAARAGSVSVHSGRTGVLLYRLDGARADDLFGAALAAIDDLDRDGHVDLAIGADLAASAVAPSGRVEVRSGASGALVYTLHPASAGVGVTTWGGHVGNAGDLDRDGCGDLFVRATGTGSARIALFSGATGALLGAHDGSDGFGRGAASVMDQDGDGVREVVISDADYLETNPTVRGRALVVSGRTGATLRTLRGDEASYNFAATVADAGDIDRDGVGDIALSVGNGTNHSHVRVVSGASGALLWRVDERSPDDELGAALARGGDVDGDGFEDLVLGAPGTYVQLARGGAAYVVSGASGLELLRVAGAAIDDRTGAAVAGIGDLDGDGRSEVLVGVPRAPGSTPGSGRVVASGLDSVDVVFDFERDDDGATPLENGRALGRGARFGRIVGLSGSGGAHFGPATFDSSPTGPNAHGPDPDLLVDRGNLVILQRRHEQSVPGIFDIPDDAESGGTLCIDLLMPARPISLDLIDIDGPPLAEVATVRLVATDGAVRTYTVPGGFTGDRERSRVEGVQRLDLETLFPQRGVDSTALTDEDPGFDAARVTRIEVTWSGSGALDALRLRPLASPRLGLRTLHRILPTIPGPQSVGYGQVLESAGDSDGDGRDDLLVANRQTFPGVELRSGRDGGLLRTVVGPYGSEFGRALVGDVDVDHDSVPDFVVGAPSERDSLGVVVGAVHAYSGASGAELWRLLGGAPDSWFGGQLVVLGDLDGDGATDLAVGGSNGIAPRAVSGANGALLWQLAGPLFAFYVLGSGADLDGDGRWDLLVGSQQGGVGGLRAYSGATGALFLDHPGTSVDPWYVSRLEALDDVDGDGVADLVAARGSSHGATLSVHSGADLSLLFVVPGEGRVVGDLDGDGWRDLVTLRPEFNPLEDEVVFTSGYSGRSGALLFRDGRRAVEEPWTLGAAGDADGDGFADFARSRMEPELVSHEGHLVEVLSLARTNGAPVCFGAPNSTGFRAVLRARGGWSVAQNALVFTATGLPSGAPVLLLSSPSQGIDRSPVVGSAGDLCVAGGPVSRHGAQVAAGLSATFPLDLTSLATIEATGGVRAAWVGETRYWQCWYRDIGAAGRSSFSDALRVTFE